LKLLPVIGGNRFPTNRWPGFPDAFSFKNPFNPEKRVWAIHSVGTNVYGYSFKDPLDPETPPIAAIRTMGTNAIPFLLSKLRERSQAGDQIRKVAVNCGMGRVFFLFSPDPVIERRQATTALLALLPLPPEALIRLQTISTNSTSDLRDCA